nr:hypothetical protein [Tanacetum cinerariifolium]
RGEMGREGQVRWEGETGSGGAWGWLGRGRGRDGVEGRRAAGSGGGGGDQATAVVSAYETPAENSLLAKTGDMTNFLNWYCRQVNKTALTPVDLECQAYEVDWTNPEGDQVRVDVNRPLPLGGLPDMLLRRVEKKSDQTCEFSVSSELKPTQDMGYLDHLPGSDKQMLSTAVKLWTQNLVIRQRVKDFQLSIESYQTQLNLTKPGWDATGYEFKHDYTIIKSPRAVVFPVNNNERKIMRFNEI